MTTSKEVSLITDIEFGRAVENGSGAVHSLNAEPGLENGRATPFVKWVGGKRNLVDALVERFPAEFNRYWEPFAGGGALFFGSLQRLSEAILSDSNLDLVLTYNVVKNSPSSLIGKLEIHAKRHSEAYYYRVRGQHDLRDPIDIAARFIYLNKTCYNGLYRVNKKGEFNVPIGSYENPEIVQQHNIEQCNLALQKARIEFREFDSIEPLAGDLVYFDPPYHPVNSTSFTKYTKMAFGAEEQQRLRDFACKLHEQGVHVILSNSDTDLIRDLYRDSPWRLETVQAPRNINSNPNGRGVVDELIITNNLA